MLRGFVGIDLSRGSLADATTLGRFRRLLEAGELSRAMSEGITVNLQPHGLLLLKDTIVDATIFAAPSSTINRRGECDPEMVSSAGTHPSHVAKNPFRHKKARRRQQSA